MVLYSSLPASFYPLHLYTDGMLVFGTYHLYAADDMIVFLKIKEWIRIKLLGILFEKLTVASLGHRRLYICITPVPSPPCPLHNLRVASLQVAIFAFSTFFSMSWISLLRSLWLLLHIVGMLAWNPGAAADPDNNTYRRPPKSNAWIYYLNHSAWPGLELNMSSCIAWPCFLLFFLNSIWSFFMIGELQ